jgi:hypothetical protein
MTISFLRSLLFFATCSSMALVTPSIKDSRPEEFACLPEFVVVSTIVLIGSVRPNQCLGVTLFSYFRFLFTTCKNYGVKKQGNLLTNILHLHISTSVRQYVSTPVRQYVSTSVRCYAVWLQYVSTSVHQSASTSVRQYISTPCYLSYINPNTLLWHNSHETIEPKP